MGFYCAARLLDTVHLCSGWQLAKKANQRKTGKAFVCLVCP